MNDQKNFILAIVLSAMVLIAWQYFIGMPQIDKQRQQQTLNARVQLCRYRLGINHAFTVFAVRFSGAAQILFNWHERVVEWSRSSKMSEAQLVVGEAS